MTWIQAVFRYGLAGAVILILSVIYIALIIGLYRLLQVKITRNHQIMLTNQGNVGSVYQIKVESPDPRLYFKLFYKDLPLVEIPEPAIQETLPEASPVPRGESTPPAAAERTPAKGGPSETAKLASMGRDLAGKAGVVASLLGTLGYLLPGSLGAKLRSKGASVRGVQTTALKTTQAPLRTQQKISGLKVKRGRLAKATARAGSTPVDHKMAPEPVQAYAGAPFGQPGVPPSRLQSRTYHAQTKEVHPGESISLTLRIDSKKKRKLEGSYLYIVHSQQVPMEPANIAIPAVTSRGTIHFKPVAAWRYWLPVILCGLVVVATLLSIAYYLSNI